MSYSWYKVYIIKEHQNLLKILQVKDSVNIKKTKFSLSYLPWLSSVGSIIFFFSFHVLDLFILDVEGLFFNMKFY